MFSVLVETEADTELFEGEGEGEEAHFFVDMADKVENIDVGS